MQHPVGFQVDDTGRARLTDFGAVLTNKVTLVTFPHTVAGAFLAAGGLVTAVALWHLARRSTDPADLPAYRTGLKFGAWTTLIAFAATAISGDTQGKIMTEVQPMKMAAAEALYQTEAPASFSILTIGTLDGSRPVFEITIPYLLSFLATGTFDGEVQGINDLQAQYVTEFGPGSYTPIIPVTYWTFRLMIGFGALAALVALWGLWAQRRGRVPTSRWLVRAGLVLPLLPLAGNAAGWIFTEMGRQPWIVFSEMFTRDGVSRSVSTGEVVTSFAAFTVLYGLLAVVEVRLLLKYARAGLPEPAPPAAPGPPDKDQDRPLEFAY
jgi:cytochrome d ubiquinol oxidase subunit I